MPRTNRVDPLGDLHAAPGRGLFTGNRGCLLNDHGRLVRHHQGTRWIICRTSFRDWKHPLDASRTWTPLFFVDDAVALAAGHRPCALCRRADYDSYRLAVAAGVGSDARLRAVDLDRMLDDERLRSGTGLRRSADRLLWSAPLDELPAGTVILESGTDEPQLLTNAGLHRFGFGGWYAPPSVATRTPADRPSEIVRVVTPPTSVAALRHGFVPTMYVRDLRC